MLSRGMSLNVISLLVGFDGAMRQAVQVADVAWRYWPSVASVASLALVADEGRVKLGFTDRDASDPGRSPAVRLRARHTYRRSDRRHVEIRDG